MKKPGGLGSRLDLSNCGKLKNFQVYDYWYKFILPASLNALKVENVVEFPDLSLCSELTEMGFGFEYVSPEQSQFEDFMRTLINCTKLENLNLIGVYSVADLTACSCLKDMSNITNLTLGGRDWYSNTKLASLSGIENLGFLNSITIEYSSALEDISGLSKLSNLKNLSIKNCEKIKSIPKLIASKENLKTISITNCKVEDITGLTGLDLTVIDLSNNNVTNLKSLENMTSLASLTLVNNGLYNIASYLDEGNVPKTVNNIDILVNLNKEGSLRTLKLSGNRGITEFSKLQNLTWNETDF